MLVNSQSLWNPLDLNDGSKFTSYDILGQLLVQKTVENDTNETTSSFCRHMFQ